MVQGHVRNEARWRMGGTNNRKRLGLGLSISSSLRPRPDRHGTSRPRSRKHYLVCRVAFAGFALLVSDIDLSGSGARRPLAATPYSMLEHIANAVRQIDRWCCGHAPSFFHRRIWRTIFKTPPRREKVYTIQHARNRRLTFADTSQQPGPIENARMTVYDLAYAAAKLQATNEKDYVNGMLGVTGLAINPDCTHDKPQYGPWTEWVRTWTRLPVPNTPDAQFL
ncbi:Putative protein of unknown function [Podospora comata]|uniref:Uncharacterized protein n=1 Tax=Podospora comata TaxID=48703 RepID=A0ABY6SEN2_PODCO|nr:Putative protein of unknown function [Podospora comata]